MDAKKLKIGDIIRIDYAISPKPDGVDTIFIYSEVIEKTDDDVFVDDIVSSDGSIGKEWSIANEQNVKKIELVIRRKSGAELLKEIKPELFL